MYGGNAIVSANFYGDVYCVECCLTLEVSTLADNTIDLDNDKLYLYDKLDLYVDTFWSCWDYSL